VAPAHQGFGAIDVVSMGIYYRLIDDLELARVKATPKVGRCLEAIGGRGVHVGPVQLEASLTIVFGKVHRKI
jgi:hypothetical protein